MRTGPPPRRFLLLIYTCRHRQPSYPPFPHFHVVPVLVTDLVFVLFLFFKEFFMHARKQQRLNSTGSQKSGSQWKVKKSKPNETRGGARGQRKKKHIEGVAKQKHRTETTS